MLLVLRSVYRLLCRPGRDILCLLRAYKLARGYLPTYSGCSASIGVLDSKHAYFGVRKFREFVSRGVNVIRTRSRVVGFFSFFFFCHEIVYSSLESFFSGNIRVGTGLPSLVDDLRFESQLNETITTGSPRTEIFIRRTKGKNNFRHGLFARINERPRSSALNRYSHERAG